MLTKERKKELLEMQEYYDCLSEEEWPEEQSSYDRWWNELTVEEREFIDNEAEKYTDFLDSTLNEIKDLAKQQENKSNELISADKLER